MSSIHARGQAVLNRVTRSLTGTGVSVTYTRGVESAELVATPLVEGQDVTALPPPAGRSNVRERVYLLVFADLTDAGFGEPQPGDTLTETVGGETEVYEVIPRGGVLPPWDWQDSAHTVVRVRCARVSDTGTQPGVGVGWGGLTWGGDRLTWGP